MHQLLDSIWVQFVDINGGLSLVELYHHIFHNFYSSLCDNKSYSYCICFPFKWFDIRHGYQSVNYAFWFWNFVTSMVQFNSTNIIKPHDCLDRIEKPMWPQVRGIAELLHPRMGCLYWCWAGPIGFPGIYQNRNGRWPLLQPVVLGRIMPETSVASTCERWIEVLQHLHEHGFVFFRSNAKEEESYTLLQCCSANSSLLEGAQ